LFSQGFSLPGELKRKHNRSSGSLDSQWSRPLQAAKDHVGASEVFVLLTINGKGARRSDKPARKELAP